MQIFEDDCKTVDIFIANRKFRSCYNIKICEQIMVSSTNKINGHDMTEMFWKDVLNANKQDESMKIVSSLF